MTETAHAALVRARRETDEIARRAAFGMALGWLLVLVGVKQAVFTASARPGAWTALGGIGAALLLVAIVVPDLLQGIERTWSRGARAVGHGALLVLLTIVYVVVVTPLAPLMRRRLRRAGGEPFAASWAGDGSRSGARWLPKLSEARPATRRSRSRLLQPLLVLATFARRGRLLMLPGLVLLLALGLILSFIQASSLAPFLYTIF